MVAAPKSPSAHTDLEFMKTALALAARGLGDTWPNPAVGCVVVKDGAVVGRGWTQSGGRPHAETEALKRAGAAAKGATAYVSLEPCSHHGKTPPCADALIAAGITRVVVATTDPDPRVSGQGLKILRAAGLDVLEGIGKTEADDLNAGFFSRITKNHPLFALKTATSLDSKIALASGESKWITGPQARASVQVLRYSFDAILVGSETVLQDDPDLTCRLDGYNGRPKVRIVLDRRLRTTIDRKIIQSARSVPTWIYTSTQAPLSHRENLEAAGATVVPVSESNFIGDVVADLAARGLTRVMIEGGGQVSAAFLKAGLISQIYWFRGGQILGNDARAAIAALGLDQLTVAPHFKRRETLPLGGDTLEILSP